MSCLTDAAGADPSDRKGSTIMTNQQQHVGGVDSHKDTIHVAVITDTGHPVADREFPTTVAGYRRAVAWLIEHGPLSAVGIEGTSSYGVGITTAVAALGIRVVEVNRTRPAERRKQGKTDRLDAYRAARSVLSGEATTDPKNASIEPLRALTVTRRSAVKAQQAAWRQIGALLVNASAQLRDRYSDLPDTKLVATLANTRAEQLTNPNLGDTMHALRSLARRYRDLGVEIAVLEARMLARATAANPALMSIKGVGAVIGAQLQITAGDNPDRLRSSASFAALCGTAPIPVSSGRTDRHRLSRGGDRQANAALHHIVKVRMSYGTATRVAVTPTWTKAGPPRPSRRSQACRRPRGLPGPSRTLRRPRPIRPAALPASQEPHPHRGRHPPGRVASQDRRARTRTSTQRRTRHPLPHLAHRSLRLDTELEHQSPHRVDRE